MLMNVAAILMENFSSVGWKHHFLHFIDLTIGGKFGIPIGFMLSILSPIRSNHFLESPFHTAFMRLSL
jgi:hypothetical protein